MAKLSHRRFSKILKRTILQNSRRKTSVVESVLDKIAGRDSRSATILKRSFHQGSFPINTSEFLAILTHTQEILVWKHINWSKYWSETFAMREKVSVFGIFLIRIFSIFPYFVRMRENKDQKNSEYGHFSRSNKYKYCSGKHYLPSESLLFIIKAWKRQSRIFLLSLFTATLL